MLSDIPLWALLFVPLYIAVLIVVAASVSASRKPSAAIAWLLTIVFVPVVGLLLFAVLGSTKLPKKRRKVQQEVNEFIYSLTGDSYVASHEREWPDWFASVVKLNQNLGALPIVGGNRLTMLPDDIESINAMVEEIDKAEHYVHVEFYLLVLDPTTKPFFEALQRATARGITVRVLSDYIACLMYPDRNKTIDYLRSIGAEWHAALPIRPWKGQWRRPDLRNHRKILVIDDAVGFTGSQNVIDASYNRKSNIKRGLRWHDLMVRIEGPAVIALEAVFASDWLSETGEGIHHQIEVKPISNTSEDRDVQILPSGPSFDNENNLKLYTTLIHMAKHRVSITSPYFVPDEALMLALVSTAARGVQIELFVSEIGDQTLVYHAQRSYYEELLRAGIKIYLYKAPAVLHSKHFSIDDQVGVIGSSNMDIRSFMLNMEVSVVVHGKEAVEQLTVVEDSYRASSIELKLEDWVKRPGRQKLWDSLARLTSSLQ